MKTLKDRVSEKSPKISKKSQTKNNLSRFMTTKSVDKRKKLNDLSSISSPNYSRGIITIDKSDTSPNFKIHKFKEKGKL